MSANSEPAIFTKLGFDPAYQSAFEDKLFIEGPQTARRLVTFFTLLLLATVIANYGVLSNSTATVIGAMIVAPLMGPMMATTSAVVMGSLPRALRAFALTVAGIIAVILFSFLLSLIVPSFTISFTSNGEITSRINPGLYALLTALGAGAAGAFIISRAEIADALGGVAIAISLVPPLCVVGISLRCGQMSAARGALLLFMTNFLAILFAGGVVLVIIGLGKLAVSKEQLRFRRRGLILFVVCLILVAIPLSLTAYQNIIGIEDNNTATVTVQNWLQGTSYQVDTVSVNDRAVSVTVDGSGQLKPLRQLANQLATALHRPISLYVRTVPALNSESQSP
ncbi:MAG: DUF389 domain-containing protein [Ktedonobacteraceae bacterium]